MDFLYPLIILGAIVFAIGSAWDCARFRYDHDTAHRRRKSDA